jgi:hypothetical protein
MKTKTTSNAVLGSAAQATVCVAHGLSSRPAAASAFTADTLGSSFVWRTLETV